MENKTDLFQDLTQEERLEALRQMATKTDSEPIRRVFSHDEKQQIKDSLAADSITLREKKKEFAAIQKEFSKAAKGFQDQIGMACDDLKRGYTENEEPVFLVDDQDEGMMHTYDQWGKYIKSRKLYPDERQTKILEMDQKAS
jgi:hypothetical protein